jgi:hypothetical protein
MKVLAPALTRQEEFALHTWEKIFVYLILPYLLTPAEIYFYWIGLIDPKPIPAGLFWFTAVVFGLISLTLLIWSLYQPFRAICMIQSLAWEFTRQELAQSDKKLPVRAPIKEVERLAIDMQVLYTRQDRVA